MNQIRHTGTTVIFLIILFLNFNSCHSFNWRGLVFWIRLGFRQRTHVLTACVTRAVTCATGRCHGVKKICSCHVRWPASFATEWWVSNQMKTDFCSSMIFCFTIILKSLVKMISRGKHIFLNFVKLFKISIDFNSSISQVLLVTKVWKLVRLKCFV